MKTYIFRAEQWFPQPLETVFAFFSDAHNLARITPPWLHFRILTPPPIVLKEGTLIDYRLKIRGVPIRWQSEITAWHPPHSFADEQRRGPYRLWIHQHTFAEQDGGTIVDDRIEYAVLGGALVQKLLVGPDIKRIFDYRQRTLERLLGKKGSD